MWLQVNDKVNFILFTKIRRKINFEMKYEKEYYLYHH